MADPTLSAEARAWLDDSSCAVVYDGPSAAMLEKGKRLFRVEELKAGRWTHADDDTALHDAIAYAVNTIVRVERELAEAMARANSNARALADIHDDRVTLREAIERERQRGDRYQAEAAMLEVRCNEADWTDGKAAAPTAIAMVTAERDALRAEVAELHAVGGLVDAILGPDGWALWTNLWRELAAAAPLEMLRSILFVGDREGTIVMLAAEVNERGTLFSPTPLEEIRANLARLEEGR